MATLWDIPNAFLKRHPFPGPGLAVSIMGEVTVKRLESQDMQVVL